VRALRYVGFVAFATLLLGGAAAGWLAYAIYGDRSHPANARQIIVARGSSFAEVARRLAAAGVITNVLTFRILAHLRGEEAAVRSGEYSFTPHLSQSHVLEALVSGGAQVATWVTIPEGFTVAEIAQRLHDSGVGSERAFLSAFMSEQIVVGGVRTRNLEGFLFPNTYLVPLDASPQQVAGPMIAEFFRQLPLEAAGRARALHISVPQGVTIASLVEREAKSEVDRPKIAEVIYNRLRLRMPLQIDATIEYALPEHKAQLSYADLRIDSPYNTYTHLGLPPTPIANPGGPSLEAAFFPAKGDDLYYVYCGNGRHVFSKTLAEHQANIARCLQ
jgi:UPF0755 protein